MSDTKICVKCEHHREVTDYRYGGFGSYLYRSRCAFGQAVDVVSGRRHKTTDCYDQRAEISFIENKCGPEGKHWKPA